MRFNIDDRSVAGSRSTRARYTLRGLPSILPPKIVLIVILAMLVLHLVFPLAVIVPAPISYSGVAVAALGGGMIVWSRRAFQAASTPIKPFRNSTALVRHGLYRWTRNPMYLGALLLVSGIAVLLGSVSPWFLVAALFVVLRQGFVLHEERILEQTFGEEYRNYKRSVRRWL